MGKIDLKHWFIGDNSLSISLVNFWIDIDIKNIGNNIYAEMKLIDSDMQTFIFNFLTLEDAVEFTENVVDKYRNSQKIAIIYGDNYKKEVDNLFSDKNDKMALTPDEVEQIIMDFFGSDDGYRISVNKEVGLHRGKINVDYYLIYPLVYSGMKKNNKIRITEGDLRNALNDYIKIYDYDLVDFAYMGEIFKSKKSSDDVDIRYDGIELTVKEKEKKLILK